MSEPSRTVLLVENDQNTSELYQRELRRDYRVLACKNETEALELLKTQSVHTIILEPALPGGQGWAFLELLHTMPHTRNIPIVLCSTLDERRRGMELGATQYLTKPVLPVTLLNVIHQVIHSSIAN